MQGGNMQQYNWPQYLGLAALGAFVGIFSGLFGVGGGIIIVPSFVLLMGLSQQTAQGLSLAFMVPTALINALTYHREGAITAAHVPLLLALVIGGVAAGPFGSVVANRLPQATLKTLFALFMVAVAVRIMPQANLRSMGWLLGVLLVAIGIRLILARA
jgi:uncharacterized membrane protein YfcA